MVKKQLNEKIKDIFFGAIIFFMMYLIIGFLLKSEWLVSSKEIWKNSYELFRDGLTLTAYFLTPVVAIVLFNDWRTEHQIKNTLQLLDDLKKASFDIKNGLGFYNAKIIKEEEVTTNEFRNRKDRQLLLWQLIELERLNNKFLIKNKDIKAFKDLQNQFKELSNSTLDDLHMKEYFSFNLVSDKDISSHEGYSKEYSKYSKAFDEKFQKLDELSKQIDLQAVEVQKSILQI